jgi:amidophosphoribosyltransferase
VIAVRDPWGLRPLVIGKGDNATAIASESCALDALGMKVVRDVRPGEIVSIGDSIEYFQGRKEQTAHCMFEYVYFARPDSIINEVSVYEVRRNLGRILAMESPVDADIVVAVPDSGTTAAIGFSQESKIPYGEGLMKNRYLGRTFIMPKQKDRENGVKIKLNPIKSEIEGKRVVLVDDSIVRGTTIRRIVNLLREHGAKEVHVRISCPPIRYPCYYGIDMQTYEEFIAQKKNVKAIEKEIGADSLAYISHEGLTNAIGLHDKLCLACLNGEYPIKDEQTKLF